MKKILQTLYLRVDSSSKSLTKRALAQLLLKIIFFLDGQATKDKITYELNSILGAKISPDRINDAFDILITDKKIFPKGDTFTISQDKEQKIKAAYDELIAKQKRVIEKYFGGAAAPPNVVSQWFEDVTIEFFNEYSSEWISDLCLSTKAIKKHYHGIQAILELVTDDRKEFEKKDKEWLKKQYKVFLNSNDDDVSSLLWAYGTSRFSSSLITANVSVDPITIDEFTNSKCILDTNILMYLDLERSRFKESFTSMENIFINLKISPVYFLITRDEFIKSMAHKRDITMQVIEGYASDVISDIDDPFIQTALHRECKSIEDFERFFDGLLDIPSVVSELLDITACDSVDLEKAIKAGQEDDKLKERINKVYKRKRHRDKRRNPLSHDAGLIAGAEHVRKKEKCFILSRDISVNEMALENPVRNEMPISIGLDTLINVLAIDNGGTDIDPTNYAPLFASIIKLALIPEKDVFKVEDLARMLDVQSQIADLPSERVKDIAKELHHNTVTGVADEEISLQLTRSFQSAKLGLQSDLDKSHKETMFEKGEKEKYFNRSNKIEQKLRKQYTGELQDKYDGERRRNRIIIFGILPLTTILITAFAIYAAKATQIPSWMQYVIGVALNVVAWALTDFLYLDKRIISKYSERVNEIESEVEKRIKEEVKE